MNILFVCTGNTCRSPMAEYYLNSLHIKGITATSAGIYAVGEPISESSAEVLREIGIDASAHISRLLSRQDFLYDRFPQGTAFILRCR